MSASEHKTVLKLSFDSRGFAQHYPLSHSYPRFGGDICYLELIDFLYFLCYNT